eukprot:4761883-Amphidinium_carterae.3
MAPSSPCELLLSTWASWVLHLDVMEIIGNDAAVNAVSLHMEAEGLQPNIDITVEKNSSGPQCAGCT